jgi:hypothetical protein
LAELFSAPFWYASISQNSSETVDVLGFITNVQCGVNACQICSNGNT